MRVMGPRQVTKSRPPPPDQPTNQPSDLCRHPCGSVAPWRIQQKRREVANPRATPAAPACPLGHRTEVRRFQFDGQKKKTPPTRSCASVAPQNPAGGDAARVARARRAVGKKRGVPSARRSSAQTRSRLRERRRIGGRRRSLIAERGGDGVAPEAAVQRGRHARAHVRAARQELGDGAGDAHGKKEREIRAEELSRIDCAARRRGERALVEASTDPDRRAGCALWSISSESSRVRRSEG